ncbi:FMN-binding protein [Maribellus sp. CM-23]|uniref:FMN-binding protein n=1 Tax=Maribellus sp. CM-23 TaxID=2781026 RepID=UPI001F16F056|nr:FMN-binding protein [Maribellus sp. CM-23]MCE4564012.1 FMN-binding protein [Maribellus sp. CM-23]
MLRILIFVCFISVAGVNDPAADFYPEEKAVGQLEKSLKTKDVEVLERFDLTAQVKNERRTVAYQFKYDHKPATFFAVFTESKGRYDLFDYLIITDKEGTIQSVSLLRYRSEHGGEIASRKWLSQFEAYSGGRLIYGEDISAISGATRSAMSITRDIPEVIQLLQTSLVKK